MLRLAPIVAKTAAKHERLEGRADQRLPRGPAPYTLEVAGEIGFVYGN
jgi:hypothetical protein